MKSQRVPVRAPPSVRSAAADRLASESQPPLIAFQYPNNRQGLRVDVRRDTTAGSLQLKKPALATTLREDGLGFSKVVRRSVRLKQAQRKESSRLIQTETHLLRFGKNGLKRFLLVREPPSREASTKIALNL
jgi:hypothetical protein